MLLVPSLVYLLLADHHGDGAWRAVGRDVRLLLMATGVVTTVPLLMFAAAAKRIPLAQVGILQYIAPTLQFLVGWRLYHEPFTHAQFVGFGAVWIALLAYAAEGYFAHRARQQTAAAVAAEEEELPLA